MTQIGRITQDEHAVERQTEPLRQRVNELDGVTILNGRLIPDITVTTNVTKRIRHGLNRKLVGFLVVRNAVVGRALSFRDLQATNPRQQDELWLIVGSTDSVSGKISLWVF